MQTWESVMASAICFADKYVHSCIGVDFCSDQDLYHSRIAVDFILNAFTREAKLSMPMCARLPILPQTPSLLEKQFVPSDAYLNDKLRAITILKWKWQK